MKDEKTQDCAPGMPHVHERDSVNLRNWTAHAFNSSTHVIFVENPDGDENQVLRPGEWPHPTSKTRATLIVDHAYPAVEDIAQRQIVLAKRLAALHDAEHARWYHLWNPALRKPSCPSVGDLMKRADWFPLELRKKLRAMAGDYDAEIRRLHVEERFRAARWNGFMARWCFWWYVLRGPVDWAVGLLVKTFTGR
jgi:hypothetical protein